MPNSPSLMHTVAEMISQASWDSQIQTSFLHKTKSWKKSRTSAPWLGTWQQRNSFLLKSHTLLTGAEAKLFLSSRSPRLFLTFSPKGGRDMGRGGGGGYGGVNHA